MDALQNQVVEQAVLQAAQKIEDQLDDQLHALENMGQDDVERLRQQRMQQLKRQADKKQRWLQQGHGEFQFLQNEKEFFASMKGEERMVCHFFRDNWPCKVIDKHLQTLCKKHLECKFVKIDAEKSPYLTDKLKIWMLPTLALIKNEKVTDYVVGLDDLGGREDFSTETLEARLAAADVLHIQDAAPAQAEEPRSVRKGGAVVLKGSDDEDSDFD